MALRWTGQVEVTDPALGIPVELHVEGLFAGNLPPDRQPWIESTLLQLLPEAVSRCGKPLLHPDGPGIATALVEQCRSILSRRGIEGTVSIERAWVATESRGRLEAAVQARSSRAGSLDDPWESTLMSAKSDVLEAAIAAKPEGARASPPTAVAVHCTVLWSNGERYPGRILDRRGEQTLVEMRDGRSHWIPTNYVEEG